MNFEDDPKLTSYALGELESAEDCAAIEALLRQHPEAAAELEETRTLAAMLRRELHADEGVPLREEQRAEVLAAAETRHATPRAVASAGAREWRYWVPVAMAACLALVLGAAMLFPTSEGAKGSARRPELLAANQGAAASDMVPSQIPRSATAVATPLPAVPMQIATATEGTYFDANGRPAPSAPPLSLGLPPSPAPADGGNSGILIVGRTAKGSVTMRDEVPLMESKIERGLEARAVTLQGADALPAPATAVDALGEADSYAGTKLAVNAAPGGHSADSAFMRHPGAIRPSLAGSEQTGSAPASPSSEPVRLAEVEGASRADDAASVRPAKPAAKSPAATAHPAAAASEAGRATAPQPARTKVAQLSTDPEVLYSTRRFDLAKKRVDDVLQQDPSNVQAREMREKVDHAAEEYGTAGDNQTRSAQTGRIPEPANAPVVTLDAHPSAAPGAPPASSAPAPAPAAAPAKLPFHLSFGGSTTPQGQGVSLADDWQSKDFAMRVVPAPQQGAPGARGRLNESIVTPPSDREYELRIVPKETERYAKNFGVFPPAEPPVILVPAERDAERVEQEVKRLEVLRQQVEPSNTEAYDMVTDNPFLLVRDNALSTFSIDVDTASYANVRRFLTSGQRPPKGAVRIEELINYFRYDYPQPQGDDPFSCTLEVAAAPWQPAHRLVRVGLRGRDIAKEKRPASNLVFLLDVSGSMQPANKLPLVKECMKQLVAELGEKDSVAITVYAGSSGTVLEPTSDMGAVRAALERLSAGGSTNGAAGIRLAYELAGRAFKKDGNNRVILCTDGDFNVGVTNQSELVELVAEKAKSGVFLSVLGFGMGNLKDSTMEKLADKGNGNYAYIDGLKEGRKVLVEEMSGTLFTIAKDVKIQVEWNPAQVGAYRLIGYENRLLAKEDFNDDTKDAGEIGAGHTVTALYEVVPAGVPLPSTPGTDALKYQTTAVTPAPPTVAAGAIAGAPVLGKSAAVDASKEMLTLKLRFKAPDSDTSTRREFPLSDSGAGWERSSPDFRWAAAVASFGMLLRDSPHKGNATWDSTLELATEGKGSDAQGHRQEFIGLVQRAKAIVPVRVVSAPNPAPPQPPIAPQSKAARLMLQEFSANDQPLLDVIDALAKKSRDSDPKKSGVQVLYAGPSGGANARLTLRLNNLSVADAARSIASAANATLSEEGDTLILRGK